MSSYYCSCNNSYTLNVDHHHCDGKYRLYRIVYSLKCYIDVDECSLGTDGCNQNCVNTDGSYLCYCIPGYYLMSDQKTCAGIFQ